ncbi:unnamed protein product [Schistosoma guineensis]|nr:unnamed protein product [Schistosoma guineensis]
MLSGVGVEWEKAKSGQLKKYHQSIKSLTTALSYINRSKLLGWGPCDCRNQWLDSERKHSKPLAVVQDCDKFRQEQNLHSTISTSNTINNTAQETFSLLFILYEV